jgi:hypothetical protein
MGTSYSLKARIKERTEQRERPKVTSLYPVRMSPFVRALNQKRLAPKVLWNGAWTAPDDQGAA